MVGQALGVFGFGRAGSGSSGGGGGGGGRDGLVGSDGGWTRWARRVRRGGAKVVVASVVSALVVAGAWAVRHALWLLAVVLEWGSWGLQVGGC